MKDRMNLRVHLPGWLTSMFPSSVWRMPEGNKELYLTFDDGPIPEITIEVLEILKKYNIKATFFCVGENVLKYPKIYQKILSDGHAVGNHTFNHIQGLRCSRKKYIDNVKKASTLIKSNMFRPPHGSMKNSQYQWVIGNYKLIMWDVISCDYDPALTPEQCFKNVVNFVRDGSIITFHDSIKAKNNVLNALPKTIEYLIKEGYSFKKIEFASNSPLKVKAINKQFESVKNNINKLLKGA